MTGLLRLRLLRLGPIWNLKLPHPRTRQLRLLRLNNRYPAYQSPKSRRPDRQSLKNRRPGHQSLRNQYLNRRHLGNCCNSRPLLVFRLIRRFPPPKPQSHPICLQVRVPRLLCSILRCPTLRSIHPHIRRIFLGIWLCSPRQPPYIIYYPK